MAESRGNKVALVVAVTVAIAMVVAAIIIVPAALRDRAPATIDASASAASPPARTPERHVSDARAEVDAACDRLRMATPWLCADVVTCSEECAAANFYIPAETAMSGLVADARATLAQLKDAAHPLERSADSATLASVRDFDEGKAAQLEAELERRAQAIEQEYGSYRSWLTEQDAWDMPPAVDLTGTESGDGIVASDGSLSFFNEHNGIVHLGAHDWSANGHIIASRPAFVIYGDSYYAYYESFVEKAHAEVLMRGPGASLWLQTCTGSNDNVVVNKYVRVG